MSQQPQGPGWWQANDGRWYPPQPPYGPPQPPYGQPYPPQRASSRRGCFIAAVVVALVFLIGGGIAAYFIYQAVHKVAEVASGVGTLGEAKCPTEADVSAAVGSRVTLKVSGSIVVASGCSYLADDRDSGTDVQITTGAALIADDEIKSFRSEATNEGATPEQIPVGDRGLAYGGDRKSAAITVSGGKLVEVEVFGAGAPIGDKQAAAVRLLQQVVDAG